MGSEIRLGPCRPCSKAAGLGAVSPHRSEPRWAEKGPPRTFTLTHAPSGTNFPRRLGGHLGNCLHQPPSAALDPEAQGVSQGREQQGAGRVGRGWCLGWDRWFTDCWEGRCQVSGLGYGQADGAVPAEVLERLCQPSWPPSRSLRELHMAGSWISSPNAPGGPRNWPLASAWLVSWGGLRPRQPGHLRWLSQLLPPCAPGLACTPPGTANPMGPILLTPP